jgi:hypothetical protein
MKKILLMVMALVLIMSVGCANAEDKDPLDYKNYKWEIVSIKYCEYTNILFVHGVFTNNSQDRITNGLEISMILYDETGKPVGAGNTYQLNVRPKTSKADLITVEMKNGEYSSYKFFMNPM